MNQQRYRIIFNKSRGQLMAVAETASAQNKSGAGQTTTSKPQLIHALAKRPRLWGAVALAAGIVCGSPQTALAQIIADPNAPANQRATVLVDGAGRPLVNIQTPSAAGVSRNTFSQFDVQGNGAVLNNSRQSNPWLAAGESRVILNEVNSNAPSYLGGAITVNGGTAQVIIANPSGIKLDGASFINASRATLTTGSAIVTGGAVTGFNVTQGSVEVTEKGLDASNTSYTDILSRAIVVNGDIKANDLSITTGSQTVDYATGQTSAIPGTGTAPVVGIDTGQLGGMYAGKITLLSTEAGVGVRNAGILQATSGQIVITADGKLENSGTVSAAVVSIATLTGDINNSGAIKGTSLVMVSSGGDLNLSGKGLTQNTSDASTVVLSAQRDLMLSQGSSATSAGVGGQVGLNAGRNITLGSDAEVSANGNVQLSADGTLDLTSSIVKSTAANVSLLAASGINLDNSTITGKQVQLETGAMFKETNAPIVVTNSTLWGVDKTTVISSGALTTAKAVFRRGGTGAADGAITLASGANMSLNETTIHAGDAAHGAGSIDIQTNANLALNRTTLSADNAGKTSLVGAAVSLIGSRIDANGTGAMVDIVATKSGMVIDVARTVSGGLERASTINTSGAITLSTLEGNINIRGLQAQGESISAIATGSTTIGNAFLWQGDINRQIATTALIAKSNVTLASLQTTAALNISGASIQATTGDVWLSSAGNTNLSTAYDTQDHRYSYCSGWSGCYTRAHTTFSNFNAATIKAATHVTASTGGQFIWANGTSLTAAQDLSLRVGAGDIKLSPNQSLLRAGRDLTLAAVTGDVIFDDYGPWNANTGDKVVFNGLRDINLRGNNIVLKDSQLNATRNISVAATKAINFGTTRMKAGQDLVLAAGQGDIYLGPTLPGKSNQLYAGQDLSLIAQTGTVTLAGVGGSSLDGSSKVSMFQRDINIQGKNVNLQGSQLIASRNLNIAATEGDVNIQPLTNNVLEGGYSNIYNNHASLFGGTSVNINAMGNIQAQGVTLSSNVAVNIQAVGNVSVAGTANKVDHYDGNSGLWQGGNGDWVSNKRTTNTSYIAGYNGVTVSAGNDIDLTAVGLSAGGGTVSIKALGNVKLGASQNWAAYSATGHGWACGWMGDCSNWTDYYVREYLTTVPTFINGRDIKIQAGNNLTTEASKLSASAQTFWGTNGQTQVGGTVEVFAGNQANYYAVQDIYKPTNKRDTRSSFWGVEYSNDRSVNVYLSASPTVTQLQSSGVFRSYSGGDQTFQGTQVSAGGGADIRAGVGETARAGARILLQGVKTTLQTSQTKTSDMVVWQKQSGSGGTTETMALPSFAGGVTFSAPGGLVVQIPQSSDFKTQIQSLTSQPGMAYLNDLTARTDVNWQPVKLAYDKWSFEQEGLTPAGAVLVAAVVAWATAGTGAGMLGSAGSTTTTVGGVTTTTYTTAGLMANAALTSLASQASITLINNHGDIDKTLIDLGKSDTAKAALTAALTAGVLAKIGAMPGMQDLSKSPALSDKLTYNLINASGRALTNTLINKGNLEDALKDALIGAMVDTAHGAAASKIKVLEADYLAHKLAHALAGCAAGAAAGGVCRDGAIGAAVGEMVAGMFDKPGAYASQADWDAYDAKVLATSKIVAGGVAAYAGGNAQTAITTAETAVRNNFLTFDENQLRKQAADACKSGNAQACADKTRLDSLDTKRDEKVKEVCTSAPASQQCQDWRTLALLARDSYAGKSSGSVAIKDLLKNARNSDIEELQSIQRLIASTPYAYNLSADPNLRTLTSIVADLTPIVGDVKGLYEAETPFDYALVMLGALGPVGDAASAAIRAAKTAHQAGNVVEAAAQLKKAETLAQNVVNGRAFEGSGLQALGVDKNKIRVTEVARTGETITIIPDAINGATLIEFKNVINIADSSQFRGYAATGKPIVLVVSPRTETISDTVWKAVVNESGGKVLRFDPVTKTFVELSSRPGARV